MQNEEIIRYTSVIALDSGGNVLVDTKGLYRVYFDFSVNVGSVAHECVILIYNLPEDAETRIKRGAKKVRLIAGSEAKNGEIFVGELVDAIPVQHETVNYLQMTLIDGDSFSASYVSMDLIPLIVEEIQFFTPTRREGCDVSTSAGFSSISE